MILLIFSFQTPPDFLGWLVMVVERKVTFPGNVLEEEARAGSWGLEAGRSHSLKHLFHLFSQLRRRG